MDKYHAIPSYPFGPDKLITSGHVTHAQPVRCSHLEICNLYPETEVSQCWVLPSQATQIGHEKTRKEN